MSAESTSVYYQTINRLVRQRLHASGGDPALDAVLVLFGLDHCHFEVQTVLAGDLSRHAGNEVQMRRTASAQNTGS